MEFLFGVGVNVEWGDKWQRLVSCTKLVIMLS